MTNTKNADRTVGTAFYDGMTRYALTRRNAGVTLTKFAAMTALGILIGIFCFFCAQNDANATWLSRDYIRTRAFSSYRDVHAYTVFFADWFCHHAVWILAVLPLCLTVYPTAALTVLCVVRGMTAGYAVSCLSGGFSVFAVFFAAMQGALCALLLMASTKGMLYAARRRGLARTGYKQFSLPFLLGDTLPFLCGLLFALGAQGIGMLAVSGICSIIH